jgi:hypothetical protein
VSRTSGQHPRRAGTTLIAIGYVFAVLLPVVGLVVGVLALSNGPRNHGVGIIALSVVVGVVSYALLF